MQKLLTSLVLIAAISVSACSESASEGDQVVSNDDAPATETDQQQAEQAQQPNTAMSVQKRGKAAAAPNMWQLSRDLDKKAGVAEDSKENAEEDSDPAGENEG
ncbi:MAG: hypothetical protein V2I79_11180 [Xanthomonadales bacterium]|jgi:hypothetical protein|nr:hypothetical protein [Xanthomonadales bacterium]